MAPLNENQGLTIEKIANEAYKAIATVQGAIGFFSEQILEMGKEIARCRKNLEETKAEIMGIKASEKKPE